MLFLYGFGACVALDLIGKYILPPIPLNRRVVRRREEYNASLERVLTAYETQVRAEAAHLVAEDHDPATATIHRNEVRRLRAELSAALTRVNRRTK